MIRSTLVVAAMVLLVPAAGLADSKKDADTKKAGSSKVIPAALFGESKPASCPSCGNGGTVADPSNPYGPGTFGRRLDRELWWENHQCAPYGCPKPIGCGNFWTEHKFIFGSCRQFFGTAGATSGRGRNTVER